MAPYSWALVAGNEFVPALPLRGCGGCAVDLGYTLSVMAV